MLNILNVFVSVCMSVSVIEYENSVKNMQMSWQNSNNSSNKNKNITMSYIKGTHTLARALILNENP